MARWLVFVVLVWLVPRPVVAQPRVTVEGLTVDGAEPPAQYRTLLREGIAPTLLEVDRCYTARLAQRRLEGTIAFRLWVSARQVIRATAETSFDDPLTECARAAIRRFTLPGEAPEGGATVRFVLRFRAPPSEPASTVPPAPPPPSAPPPSAPTPVQATPPRSQLRVRVRTTRGANHEEALARVLTVEALEPCGVHEFEVRIDRRGRLRQVAPRRESASRCIDAVLRPLRVAPRAGRALVQIEGGL